jgi:hypothetical protein
MIFNLIDDVEKILYSPNYGLLAAWCSVLMRADCEHPQVHFAPCKFRHNHAYTEKAARESVEVCVKDGMREPKLENDALDFDCTYLQSIKLADFANAQVAHLTMRCNVHSTPSL